MSKTLIIDGVKFNLWIPEDEEKDLQPMVKEHCKEIFGKYIRYIDIPLRLKSDADIGSEPDFVVIDPANSKFYIVEVELSKHPAYNHILDQLSRFISGLENVTTTNMIAGALCDIIDANKSLQRFFADRVTENVFRWLLKLMKTPSIVVVIEEKTPLCCRSMQSATERSS